MKYLDERVEDLELEVKLLKAKNKLEETKKNDYMYNHSNMTLLSEPNLETAFASPWDSSELYKNPLDTITVNLSSIVDDTISNSNYVDSYDLPEYCPPYPNIIGSWDDKPWGIDSGYDKLDKDFLEFLNSTEKKIEKDFGKIISKFKILHHEWEMDGYGYIVKDLEYNKNIIVTNHGKPMIVNKDYLNEMISSYKETIQETERAMFLVK